MEPHIWINVWIAVAIICAVAEFLTGGFFLLPFAIGSALAAVLEYLWPGSIDAQWAVFVIVSSATMIALRRLVLRRERARGATASADGDWTARP